jgi:hypothetical protein
MSKEAAMPSEYIDDSREEQCQQGFRTKVNWSKREVPGGSVQIGTLGPPETQLKAENPASNGWFVDLDRAGLNRLIRTLRKARDDAYGRDE